jgi:propanediol utilization protein
MRIKVTDVGLPPTHEWYINGLEGVFINGVEREVDVPEGLVISGRHIEVSPVGLFSKKKAGDEEGDK